MAGKGFEKRFGIITKAELNRLKVENTANQTEIRNAESWMSANGIYMSGSLSRFCFIDASVLLSRARYEVNYARDNAVFLNADLRFLETNLHLNLILNPRSEKLKVYGFGGMQLLSRRWGEETFIDHALARTFWPSSRVMYEAGAGMIWQASPVISLQPFGGFRYAVKQQVVYDVNLNQWFAGLVLGFNIKGKPKDRYRKCPTDF